MLRSEFETTRQILTNSEAKFLRNENFIPSSLQLSICLIIHKTFDMGYLSSKGLQVAAIAEIEV